jgi:5-methylcytosine-specific restriction endonuclease McrA
MRRVRAHAVVGKSRVRHRGRYAAYMESGKWHRRRRDWEAHEEFVTGAPVRCAVCGTADWSDLHHLTYDRLGDERHEDLVALCRECHEELHRAYDAGRWRGMSYESVMRRLLRLAQERRGVAR